MGGRTTSFRLFREKNICITIQPQSGSLLLIYRVANRDQLHDVGVEINTMQRFARPYQYSLSTI